MQDIRVSHAIVGAMLWLPEGEVDAHRVRDFYTIKKHGTDFRTKKPTYEEIPLWRDGKDAKPAYRGYIGIPITDGLMRVVTPELREEFAEPVPFISWTRRPDPNHELAAEGQAEFMDLTEAAVRDNYAALVKAATGTGKTAVGLETAARLGVRTLILVPLERLRLQWIAAIERHLGVPPDRIGTVVGPKCQWGRDIVVGMMKSVAMKDDYPPEFYQAFGFVITDEVHNTGAALASQVQGRFNAEWKLALSATDKRKDGGDRVYYSQYGKPAFARTMNALETDVYILPYTADKPPSGDNKTGKLISLAYDFTRNRIITDLAVGWYRGGHFPLFLVDHVRHAEILRKMFLAAGIPENALGMYCGEAVDDDGSRGKSSPEYLKWVEDKATVVIAITAMMKEGIDMPRLDRGMDVSPRSDLTQQLGRIRRIHRGKTRAAWVMIRDRADKGLEGLYFARTNDIKTEPGVTIRKTTEATVLTDTLGDVH